MQTSLPESLLQTAVGREADEILRTCVHCGFCNATCPTYQLTGNELDGPRGRIYLIKQALEGQPVSPRTRFHLDRCLTCRACETTCPSGVDYHHLLDTGREHIEQRVPRSVSQRLLRWGLRRLLTRPRYFAALYRTGRALRSVLPQRWRRGFALRPLRSAAPPDRQHPRRMLLLEGCVQAAIAPQINTAARQVLDSLGISTASTAGSGCCGALSHHLGATAEALDFMRRNIDAWWPAIEAGTEAIVITASGCATQVKKYARLLAHDARYAGKAARIAELARDISEVIRAELPHTRLLPVSGARKIAFHSPCSLQHGQRLDGVVEDLLVLAGYELVPVADAHLCCGSAGTYSILQPAMAAVLRSHKLQALQAGGPAMIATANIGCLAHMAGHARVPVRHWIELLAPLIPEND